MPAAALARRRQVSLWRNKLYIPPRARKEAVRRGDAEGVCGAVTQRRGTAACTLPNLDPLRSRSSFGQTRLTFGQYKDAGRGEW